MKLWIVRFGSTPIEYTGEVPYDFSLFGIDWFICRAISVVDAERQARLYLERRHPIQPDLEQEGRTIRVLAGDDESKARAYFMSRYPLLPTLDILNSRSNIKQQTYILRLEAIGLEAQRYIRAATRFLGEEDFKFNLPWVAEIVGLHPKFKFNRSFLSHQTDYSEANGLGNRGVYFVYTLKSGSIYEVYERTSRKSSHRFFCTVEDANLVKMSAEEVVECLKKSGLA